MSREFNTNLNCNVMGNYKLKKKLLSPRKIARSRDSKDGKSERNDFLSRVFSLLQSIKKLIINTLR